MRRRRHLGAPAAALALGLGAAGAAPGPVAGGGGARWDAPRFEAVDLPPHVYRGGWEHMVGGGVAVLDCDGDGLPEVVAAGGEAPAVLLRNRGAMRFEADTPAALAVAGVTGAYPLDLDGDARLDLAVLRAGPDRLLRGGPDCAFAPFEAGPFADPRLGGGDGWTTAFSATWEEGRALPTLAFGRYVDRADPDGPWGTCDHTLVFRPERAQGPTRASPAEAAPGGSSPVAGVAASAGGPPPTSAAGDGTVPAGSAEAAPGGASPSAPAMPAGRGAEGERAPTDALARGPGVSPDAATPPPSGRSSTVGARTAGDRPHPPERSSPGGVAEAEPLGAAAGPQAPPPEGPAPAPDATRWAYGGPIRLPGHCALSMLFSDWGRRGRADLRVTNDRHYHVDRGAEQLWAMEDAPRPYGPADGFARLVIWGMGIASRDVTGDGVPEVYLTSMGDNHLRLPVAGAEGPAYADAPFSRGHTTHRPHAGGDPRPSTSWHAAWGDVTNDGRDDLFVAKGNVDAMPMAAGYDPDSLLFQRPDGTFREAAAEAGVASLGRGRGAALADLDGDGRLDLVVAQRRAALLAHRNVSEAGAWVAVEPRQPGPNGRAVGAWIEVEANGRRWHREVTVGGGHAGGQALPEHFGLGGAEAARARVTWPDGTVSDWVAVAPGRAWVVERGEGAAVAATAAGSG